MSYRVAPIFLIRLAGAPFECIEQLATPETSRHARQLLASSTDLDDAGKLLLAQSLDDELQRVRTSLWDSARSVLAPYLVFAGGGARELLSHLLDASRRENFLHRNAKAGDRERHLLLYLQRIAAKNDTFSAFGPSGWGTVAEISGVRLQPESGIAKRDAFMERWTAHAVVAVINADVNDIGLKLAVPALESHAMEILRDDLAAWPPGPARDKWWSILNELVELSQKFPAAKTIQDRQSVLAATRGSLESIGAQPKATDRFLYAATNPIGEECFRECHFEISESLINEVATDAEPWIDLWRDNYAFVASRVAAGLRGIMEKAGAKSGVMPLPAFLQAAESAKLPLTGPGLVAFAVMAFQEVKEAFRKRVQPHVGLSEYELTPEDCHVVRDNFDYPKFDEYTYPSADLQLAAESAEAVARGNYQWILAELHPPIALLHHCMFWSCPDKAMLGRALASTAFGRPNFHFGFFAADFTAHTAVRVFDAMPELTNFVAPHRANPKWRKIPPAEAEVYLDEASGDVCVRRIDNRENLGSFARAWVIPLGFHPFQFSAGPHTPRLRCGKVIVQRRAWTISAEEFPAGKYNGVSSSLVLAVEKLRAEKNLPRFVYIRPTEQALRRSGAEGRDKDTKPVFIDLESYLFLEIFYRWIIKAGEIEVTEMLPTPEQLLWKEADGRRSFELRTMIVPRS